MLRRVQFSFRNLYTLAEQDRLDIDAVWPSAARARATRINANEPIVL